VSHPKEMALASGSSIVTEMLCRTLGYLIFAAGGAASGCSASTSARPSAPVTAAPPPKDDGAASQGGAGGTEHAAAMEQLKIAPMSLRSDKQNSLRVLLPDAPHWTRVKFWGVPSLVGFRYGKDHHAIVAAFVTHVDAPADGSALPAGACLKSFEEWAMPWVDRFDVDVKHDAPVAVMWNGPRHAPPGTPPQIVDIDSVFAKVATVAYRDGYAGAYAAYPAWKGACLIIGVAVPAREDEARAREVRDRFAREVLPHVQVTRADEPKEMY
jgi:hypothetical protein